MEASLGYYFKNRNIKYRGKNYEVFEFKDFVFGLSYKIQDQKKIFHIMSGKYTGEYVYVIGDERTKEDDIVLLKSLEDAIKENNNSINFVKIREKEISKIAKYYLKNGNSKLIALNDTNLINFLEQEYSKHESDFREEIFENSTDISTMYNSIKKTIISQDEQIMQILTSLFKNQKVVNSNLDIDLVSKLKENILICGPTGTGKTEILKRISKLYNIPIVIEDATSLSETGYSGRNITDMLEDLLLAAGNNLELAEKGILVIDEFDKLAENPNEKQSHVSRIGVQRSLLKLLDGSSFYFNNKQFNTSKLTIVALGAFTDITNKDDYNNLTTEDFVKYGIIRELIGRFSKTITMNSLSKEDIIKILKNSDFSPINTYRELFSIMQIDFKYNDDFIEWVAEQAVSLNTGARCLKTVFDDCISSAMFRIFAGEYSAISLIKPNEESNKPYILTKSKTK